MSCPNSQNPEQKFGQSNNFEPGTITTMYFPTSGYFFAIGLTLVSLYFFVYPLWKKLVNAVWNHFTVSAHIYHGMKSNDEELGYNVLKWLTKNIPEEEMPRFAAIAIPQCISVLDRRFGNQGVRTFEVSQSPAHGVHYFKYKDTWIRLEIALHPKLKIGGTSSEKITFTTWRGPGKRELLEEILKDSVKRPLKKIEEEKIYVFAIDPHARCWNQSGEPKRKRPLSSVILAEGSVEKTLEDVNGFISRKAWYLEREIPHRRGYLLYGPPGCGKTSFVKALAAEIGFSICVLSLSAKNLTDENLTQLMDQAPRDSILLLEDIDAAFKSREDGTATTKEMNLAFEGRAPSTLTFRGLLNALDGVASAEGRIICMTTNYLDRLDPALIRSGRVDHKILIDYPTKDQLMRLFGRFYADSNEPMREEFAKRIGELNQKVSVAAVQGLFLLHKDSAEDALKNLETYFEEELCIGKIKLV